MAPARDAAARDAGRRQARADHACNLRCGFCYTDSPRHTLARTPELSDEDWLAIVDEAIELGALEAVVTGGEPLLRRDLTLEAIERLDAAGVGTTLNTNGWFVDDAVADRLAALSRAVGLRLARRRDVRDRTTAAAACPAAGPVASRGSTGCSRATFLSASCTS